jgi:hypothetical protein
MLITRFMDSVFSGESQKEEAMKVIFLDIEGVIVTGSHLIRSAEYEGYQFNPICVKNLKEIIESTDAYIVVGSTWRKTGFDRLKEIFHSSGLHTRLIGQTPVIDYSIRGEEIKQYIKESSIDPAFMVGKFVILDDNDDMGELLPYLVQTNWSTGLDQSAKETAIKMLL